MRSISSDPVNVAQRRRYRARIEHYRKKSRGYQKKNPVKAAIYQYKSKSKNRDIIWAISDRHAEDLMTDNCYYCGVPPNTLNGIDRVDNQRGYEEDNVVTACLMCNIGKNDYTKAEFLSWALRVARSNYDFA